MTGCGSLYCHLYETRQMQVIWYSKNYAQEQELSFEDRIQMEIDRLFTPAVYVQPNCLIDNFLIGPIGVLAFDSDPLTSWESTGNQPPEGATQIDPNVYNTPLTWWDWNSVELVSTVRAYNSNGRYFYNVFTATIQEYHVNLYTIVQHEATCSIVPIIAAIMLLSGVMFSGNAMPARTPKRS